jgi:hypothetical protein
VEPDSGKNIAGVVGQQSPVEPIQEERRGVASFNATRSLTSPNGLWTVLVPTVKLCDMLDTKGRNIRGDVW